MTALNYHHLRLFHRIAHEGSLTRAAEFLNLSQSALSVQLQKLEQQLGHDLFERRGKKLILTEAGRIALDYADTVFETGDELIKVLQGRPRTAQHVLRVGALTTLSRNFQLAFLRPLIGRPDVELVLRSGTMHDLLTQLEMHSLDVVLATIAVRRDAATDLHSHLIAEQPVSLVGRPRPDGELLRFPEALRTVPVMLPSLDSEIRVALDRVLSLWGIHPIIQAEVDDMAMLRLLAREGDGVAVVPPIVVQDELNAGLLIEHCRIPDVTERFYAIIQTRRFPNPLLRELVTVNGSLPGASDAG
ncbi:LysR family transcriptional regulator, transcriptional activator of nhaA [Methylobacterium sp. UNC378MF]|jgi:LysR family transcriptional regulator, transcriptional activator of nhaA|uniref:LysR family transcriptional regulator n=1 Tax=Methylobacterium sp. UNC378MF TaxID=1502748 RepID=UPI00088640F3|nr:LysR family transcriptional regulator [Methylobacterium sp. UNC378MF]SDA34005.1 LysR family transcriptional regulator, transcriptional activator of nhaA [Methylobacterium sp. UNC378MF]